MICLGKSHITMKAILHSSPHLHQHMTVQMVTTAAGSSHVVLILAVPVEQSVPEHQNPSLSSGRVGSPGLDSVFFMYMTLKKSPD